ncbi:MAG: glycosyltransferase [Candidatus Lokiarchaeota archaeon]|nr:glycosyltransferase [Candidatus Lokiarchaeota archaeon]
MNKLNLNAPINSLGYGVVGYNIWKSLNSCPDTDITLFPISNQVSTPCLINENQKLLLQSSIQKQDIFDATSPTLKIWHENQLADRIGKGKFIAWPFFEVNKFDNRRRSHLQSVDEIIVSSKWAKQIVEKYVGSCVHVVPCGVDRHIFNETTNKPNTSKCIFFNCGKWEIRKGHDVLHKAFKDAFPMNQNVELWMMTENPFLNQQEKSYWESKYKEDRIKLIPRVQWQEELANIISSVHCGVFPARSEGWNLEILEMMSMGKKIITTNYSAHTEFCNQENCNLINIEQEEPIFDGKWFVGDNGTWASLEGNAYDQLVNAFKSEYNSWKENPFDLNEKGIETSKELSWNNSADKVKDIFFGDN